MAAYLKTLDGAVLAFLGFNEYLGRWPWIYTWREIAKDLSTTREAVRDALDRLEKKGFVCRHGSILQVTKYGYARLGKPFFKKLKELEDEKKAGEQERLERREVVAQKKHLALVREDKYVNDPLMKKQKKGGSVLSRLSAERHAELFSDYCESLGFRSSDIRACYINTDLFREYVLQREPPLSPCPAKDNLPPAGSKSYCPY